MKTSPQVFKGIAELPNCPALYALYGGTGKRAYVAYVGITDRLKRRMAQHLVTRDSSAATGTSATGINPDYVTEIRWWDHHRFSDPAVREAAELVAFDLLDPVLRSRKSVGKAAQELLKSSRFRKEMETLIKKGPSGHLLIPSLEQVALRLSKVEDRLHQIEEQLKTD
ncbi:MAG: hypothetical protein WBV60_20815 [Terriglobales bacterium]